MMYWCGLGWFGVGKFQWMDGSVSTVDEESEGYNVIGEFTLHSAEWSEILSG